MQHIVKPIKAVTKSYTTKSGVKESVSKRVDIGVDDTFDVGESVAIISETDLNNVEKTIADKDATITDLNGSIDKYKSELDVKTNKIGDLSKEIKALKTKVAELESGISAKDETIDELTATVDGNAKKLTDSENVIDGLNDKVDELTAAVGKLKPLLLSKDDTISELEKQIAVYDAIDVDKLKEKADELDTSKNVVILQQKQITEYIQLVNFHKETATAYKNQNAISKLIGRDAATDIATPTLFLIDLSGNPIVDDADDDATAIGKGDDSGKTASPNEN